ncbi:hypothetical protein PpBr36_01217, partial [Pyricularia pennisetigena]|uniref:hypothetical protein n=1 Tax=Pyricularia pennisetigena TaxID=1578925 RepID=UPI001150F830
IGRNRILHLGVLDDEVVIIFFIVLPSNREIARDTRCFLVLGHIIFSSRGPCRLPTFFFVPVWQEPAGCVLVKTRSSICGLADGFFGAAPAGLDDVQVSITNIAIFLPEPVCDAHRHEHFAPHGQGCRRPLRILFARPLSLVLGQLFHDTIVMLLCNHDPLDDRNRHPVSKLKVDHCFCVIHLKSPTHLDRTSEWDVHRTLGAHVLGKEVDVPICVLWYDPVLDRGRNDPVRLVHAVETLEHLLSSGCLGRRNVSLPVHRGRTVDILFRELATFPLYFEKLHRRGVFQKRLFTFQVPFEHVLFGLLVILQGLVAFLHFLLLVLGRSQVG